MFVAADVCFIVAFFLKSQVILGSFAVDVKSALVLILTVSLWLFSSNQRQIFRTLAVCHTKHLYIRHCVRAVKEMDSKSIGLGPRGSNPLGVAVEPFSETQMAVQRSTSFS